MWHFVKVKKPKLSECLYITLLNMLELGSICGTPYLISWENIVGVPIQWFVSDGNGKTECNLRNEKWMRFISRRIIIKFHRWRLTLCGIFYLHAYLCHQNKFKWGCINMFIQRSCDIWPPLPWPIISVRCVPIVSVDITQRALCAYEMIFFNICFARIDSWMLPLAKKLHSGVH